MYVQIYNQYCNSFKFYVSGDIVKDVLMALNAMHVPCEEIAPRIHYRSGFVELRGTIETCTLCRVLCIIDYCCPPLLHNLHRYTLSDRLGMFHHRRIRNGRMREHIHIERYNHVLTLNDARSGKQISHLPVFLISMNATCLIYCENIASSIILTESTRSLGFA